MPTSYRLPITSLRPLAPIDRIAAIADANSIDAVVAALASPRPSPHLARWGIIARDDDGIVFARLLVHGSPVLAAAQDSRFLGGSVGAKHGEALVRLFEQAREERPAAVVLLLASGGVRLHEANPAELALARALRGLLDTRVAGIPVLTLAVGDVFGGASVVACASDRVALLPETRLGLSGPKVIEMVHGRDELEADDADDVDKLFGEKARAAAGQVELLVDDIEAIRSWIALAARTQGSFDVDVLAMHARLGARLAAAESNATARNQPTTGQRKPLFVDRDAVATGQRLPLFVDSDAVDQGGWLWKARGRAIWITRPAGASTFGPRQAHALDTALLAQLSGNKSEQAQTLIVIEDSSGHEATRSAEAAGVAQYLAHHAAVLALLRARGVRVLGLLAGVGHSAAFFANALQAPFLCALDTARVIAMDPAAIARVTRLDAARVGALIESDPLLGQPVRCFAHSGGVAEIRSVIDDSTLSELVAQASAGSGVSELRG
jgi:malonate decarboxylase beta subunit